MLYLFLGNASIGISKSILRSISHVIWLEPMFFYKFTRAFTVPSIFVELLPCLKTCLTFRLICLYPGAPAAGDKFPSLTTTSLVGTWDGESVPPDDTALYAFLTRPLPDYALEHVFNQHGNVEFVKVHQDARYAFIKLRDADSAHNAL